MAMIIATNFTLSAYGQETYYETGKSRWLAGNYSSAYDNLMIYRKQPYGRRPEVDYMLGTSGCRLTALRDWGYKLLEWMPYGYALTRKARELVNREMSRCKIGGELSRLELPEEEISAGMSAKGKTFYWLDRDIPINSYPARRLQQIPKSDLANRLTPLGRKDEAISKMEALLGSFKMANFRIVISDCFIIASSSGHSEAQLRDIANDLNKYLTFFVKEYGIIALTHYMSIYLVPDIETMRKFARNIHSLDVSPATIGYTFREDLSIVGVIPGKKIGTLFHELFHLTVRSNFGNIPQWLDEGIAALYEVSIIRGEAVVGEPNWRGAVLAQLWNERPSLAEVIRSKWFSENLPEEYDDPTADKPSVKKQAAHMAMARYFALYLQEKKKLSEVYIAFRDLDPAKIEGGVQNHALKLVEQLLGKPLQEVDADFVMWFRKIQKKQGNQSSG
jgi:hypothetical protein